MRPLENRPSDGLDAVGQNSLGGVDRPLVLCPWTCGWREIRGCWRRSLAVLFQYGVGFDDRQLGEAADTPEQPFFDLCLLGGRCSRRSMGLPARGGRRGSPFWRKVDHSQSPPASGASGPLHRRRYPRRGQCFPTQPLRKVSSLRPSFVGPNTAEPKNRPRGLRSSSWRRPRSRCESSGRAHPHLPERGTCKARCGRLMYFGIGDCGWAATNCGN